MRGETRSSIVLVLGTGATAVLSLAYNIWAGKVLGPAEYATFGAAISFVYLCSIAVGPVNATLAHFTARFRAAGEPGKVRSLASAALRRVAVAGLLACGIVALATGPLAGVLRMEHPGPLQVALTIVYLTLLLAVPRGLLRGAGRFGSHNANLILEAAIRLLAGVLLLRTTAAATAGLAAYLVALAVALAFAGFQVRGIASGPAAALVDRSLVTRFAGSMLLFAALAAAFQNLDVLFAKHYFAAHDAGLYAAAIAVARVSGIVLMPFNALMLPLITSLAEEGQPTLAPLLRVTGYYLLLAAAPLALFWGAPHAVMRLLYGEPYVAAAGLLLPLGAALTLGHLAILLAHSLAARQRFGFVAPMAAGLTLEIWLMVSWHRTPRELAGAVLAANALLLAPVALLALREARRS